MDDSLQIRSKMQKIRSCMSINEVEQYSATIDERLFEFIDEHPMIRSVLVFYPKEHEPALIPLYERLSGMYRLYFPVTGKKEIDFFMADIKSTDDFRMGSFDIMEPVSRKSKFPMDETESLNTVAIVPGLAFDTVTKGRIGYGRGYYDRFLAKHKDIYKIGVCYDFQMLENLPQNENDTAMDMIITNTKYYE